MEPASVKKLESLQAVLGGEVLSGLPEHCQKGRGSSEAARKLAKFPVNVNIHIQCQHSKLWMLRISR